MFGVWLLLPVGCCLLAVVCCLVFVWFVFVVLCIACCLLVVVCCLVFVDACVAGCWLVCDVCWLMPVV